MLNQQEYKKFEFVELLSLAFTTTAAHKRKPCG